VRRQLTGEFIKTELDPALAGWERQGGFPRDLWLAFARRGLLAPHVPPEHGGAGAPLADSVSIIEQLAHAGLESVAISINVHANIFVSYLLADGTAEQRARYLPRACTGELVGAVAITGAEPCSAAWIAELRSSCGL
jgi:acyl-CoA dehydrogenase